MKSIPFLLFLALCAASCGSPDAPGPSSVAGTWAGTFQSVQGSGSTVGPFTMTLTQAGDAVSGTWQATGTLPANGTVAGSTTATEFSGRFTFNSTNTNGTPCTGGLSVSGNAGGNTIIWTSPVVAANCTILPTNITISAQKR